MVEGHFAYVVVATIVITENDVDIKQVLSEVVGPRSRGFHWTKEGPQSRSRMVDCLQDLGACAHIVIHHPTGRRGQERARNAALRHLLPLVVHDGVDEILIESRDTRQDARDRALILGRLLELGCDDIAYDWGDKSMPELWLPDAVCGAVAMYLNQSDPGWYERLQESGVITEPRYISGA